MSLSDVDVDADTDTGTDTEAAEFVIFVLIPVEIYAEKA